MSIIPPGLNRDLQFYLSGPLPCPYLPAQVERKLFARLPQEAKAAADINAALCRAGFRRSHDIVYRPACPSCNACVPVRIPVARFKPSRGQRRVAARNADLSLSRADAEPTAELYRLFSAYERARHADSDMAHMGAGEFAAMLREGRGDARLYQLCDAAQTLLGCVIADEVGDGLSAVYSFFAPGAEKRSLGTQLILSLVAEARQRGLAFVYLGYWIEASRKMSYKSRFRPLQYLGPQGWAEFGEGERI